MSADAFAESADDSVRVNAAGSTAFSPSERPSNSRVVSAGSRSVRACHPGASQSSTKHSAAPES